MNPVCLRPAAWTGMFSSRQLNLDMLLTITFHNIFYDYIFQSEKF